MLRWFGAACLFQLAITYGLLVPGEPPRAITNTIRGSPLNSLPCPHLQCDILGGQHSWLVWGLSRSSLRLACVLKLRAVQLLTIKDDELIFAILAALKCARNRSPTLVKLYGASAAYLALLWLGIPLTIRL